LKQESGEISEVGRRDDDAGEEEGLKPPAPRPEINLEMEKMKDLIPRLRELLKQRDDSITSGDKQMAITNARNEALRSNLDQVEPLSVLYSSKRRGRGG